MQLLGPDSDDSYKPRPTAENSEAWKQILTYVLVTRGDEVLSFKRGNFSRVEDTLRGSICIGFGGHVVREDFDLLTQGKEAILRSAARELLEELKFPPIERRRLAEGTGLQIAGILNDDSSSIGRKHIAYILRMELLADWPIPLRGEKSIAQLQWIKPSSLNRHIWNFEYWSQLCLREFFPSLAQSASTYKLLRPAKIRDAHTLFVMGTVGSGKTEAAKLIAERTNRIYINTGSCVADLIGIPAVSQENREEFQKKALEFITSSSGPSQLALYITDRTSAAGGRAIIDGVRQRSTLDLIRTKLGSKTRTALLYVHTTPDMAHRFYCGRRGSKIPFLQFLATRDAQVEREVPTFLKDADGVVYNWFGVKQYNQTIRELIQLMQRHEH